MAGEYFKVTEHVRGVVDGRVVVRRRGARIPVELAVKLGLVKPPPEPPRKPRRPAGTTTPRRKGR